MMQTTFLFWQDLKTRIVLLTENIPYWRDSSFKLLLQSIKTIFPEHLENFVKICRDETGEMFAWNQQVTNQRYPCCCFARFCYDVVIVRPDKYVFGHYSCKDFVQGIVINKIYIVILYDRSGHKGTNTGFMC